MGEFFAGLLTGVGTLFVIGTATFWIASIILFGLLTWFTEDDKDFLAVVFIGGFIWISASVNDWSIIANPLLWVKWFAIYIAAGAAWSFVKWFSFLHKAKDSLRGHIVDFGVAGKPSTWTELQFKKFAEQLYRKNYVSGFLAKEGQYTSEKTVKKPEDLIPSVKNRFGNLVRWIIWWPMSVVWTVLNDPIRRIAEFIVRSLKTSYTRVANSVFGNEI